MVLDIEINAARDIFLARVVKININVDTYKAYFNSHLKENAIKS